VSPQEFVVIGRLGRPHGVTGGIRVRPTGPTLDTLEVGAEIVSRGPEGERRLRLAGRSGAEPHIILTFDGVSSRDEAAALSGVELLAPPDALPPLDDEETFYVRDLIGCAVTVDGEPHGEVADVIPGAANDSLEIERDGKWTLVPFISEAVVSLDLAARRIDVRGSFVV
jgi:16S rRNA processing protein RimM